MTCPVEELRELCNLYFNGSRSKGPAQLFRRDTLFPTRAGKLTEKELYARVKMLAEECETAVAIRESGEIFQVARETFFPDLQRATVFGTLERIYGNAPFFDYIIHGSYADGSCTAASDIDDLIIVKEETFLSLDNFRRARKILSQLALFYQRVDPVQHHGHWIFTEYDLRSYDQSIMPVSVLEGARAVGRDVKLELCLDAPASLDGFNRVFDGIVREGRRDAELLFEDRCNLYHLKELISAISLLLPLLFQVTGSVVSKKEAIARAGEILDPAALRVLRWSTRVRERWHELPGIWCYRPLRMLSHLIGDRNILESVARKYLPAVGKDRIGLLDGLSREDFDHFFDHLEALRHEPS
jgi:predicted nucleotidyltransferase